MTKKLFVMFYAAISASFLIYLAASSFNYLQFYPALQSLRADPADQQIIRDPQSRPTEVLLHISISNPTGYSGIKIKSIVVRLYFAAYNNSIFQGFQLLGSNSSVVTLAPGASLRFGIVFPLIGNQSSLLASFLNTYGSAVVSQYNVHIHILSFLDALAPTLEVVREFRYPNS